MTPSLLRNAVRTRANKLRAAIRLLESDEVMDLMRGKNIDISADQVNDTDDVRALILSLTGDPVALWGYVRLRMYAKLRGVPNYGRLDRLGLVDAVNLFRKNFTDEGQLRTDPKNDNGINSVPANGESAGTPVHDAAVG